MTNPVKKQLAADFEKAKSTGSVRVERIRQIFQDALAQTVTELKQGTGETRSIARDSISTLTENLKNTQATPQEVVPVQVEIQDDSVDAVILVVEPDAESSSVHSVLIENQSSEDVVLPQAVIESSQEQALSQPAELPAAESFTDSLKGLIAQVMRSLKEGEAYATFQQQLVKLKQQMSVLDAKLASRYGDRYEGFKQEFNQDVEKTKTWYEGMKTDANVRGMNVVEYKQAELVIKMGEAGVTIAQKEEKIKQLLKELWQTTTKF